MAGRPWHRLHPAPYQRGKPTVEELRQWIARSGLPARKFFNTSGLVYRSLGLKDKLDTMTEEEQIALLATDGMLVKRPLLVGEDFVLPGFKPADWEKRFYNKDRIRRKPWLKF